MLRTMVLLIPIALLAAGCGSEASSETIQQPTTSELPADVRSVATASQPPVKQIPVVGEAAAAASGAISATGEFISPSRSELAPKFPGRVAAVYVDAGERVTRGQPVAALESEYMRIDLQGASAELERASAAASDAERDFARKKELRDKDSIPQATFDRSLTMLEQTRASRSSAAAAVAMARQRLADTVLRSPINGVVAERRTDLGEHLGEAGVAFVILQTAPLKLRFNLPERYLGHVRSGQSVVAKVDPYPGEEFRGVVKTVGGVIDPANRTFFAEAEFANRDGRLRPGLFARVEMASR